MSIQSIIDEWENGKKWIDSFTRDFPELDSLADGVALSNVQNAPNVGDIRLANAVRQIPRASIQQMPTFSAVINGTKLSIDAIFGSFLLRSVVFNEDTFGTGVLSTMQLAGESALTRGFQPLMANTGKVFNQFGTTLKAVHYDDVVIENGVFDASDSLYYHVRTRVTPARLDEIIKAAEKNEDTLWNVKALKKLREMGPDDRSYNENLSQARQNPGMQYNKQYDFITRYGVGPYYDVTVYSPRLSETHLMKYKSRSKFGFPRVAFLVIDPAQLLPFGVSRARLASPYANYANIYLQSTAKMQLLNADPPVFRRGMFTSATTLRRGAEWSSIDPNADIQIKELSNSTLQQFEPVLNFIGNQIESVMGVGDSLQRTNSAYQNTAAVQQRAQLRQLGSAQVTAILENALRQYALTALDLYISEQTGTDPVVIDDEAKNAINSIEPDFVGDDNIIEIDWEAYYERIHTMSVNIDMSISKQELEDKKRADLQDLAMGIRQNSDPNDPQTQHRAQIIEDKMIESVAPDLSRQLSAQPEPMDPYGGAEM